MKKCLAIVFVFFVFQVSAQISDFGMTSPAHKDHVGEIVFSKKPINFQGENPSEFTSQFSYPEDKIYFMAYFPKSIANRCHEEHGVLPGMANANIIFAFYVNGEKAGEVVQGIDRDQLNKWTGWSDPQNPFGVKEGYQPKYGFLFRDEVVTRLKKGDNKVRMVVGYKVAGNGKTFTNKAPVTEGTMHIHSKTGYKKEYKAPPKAVMTDAALAAKIKESLAYRWRKTSIIKEVILTDKTWEVQKNAAGVPVRKVLSVHAITSPKNNESSNKCFVSAFEVKKKYIGNGKYSDEIIWFSSGPSYEVECK